MLSAPAKDPLKVAAGQASARARWGLYPRTVRLDDLTSDQRRLVLALVSAARENEAAGFGDPTAQEDESDRSRPPTQAV